MIFSLENKDPEKTALRSDTGCSVTYGALCLFSEKMNKMLDKGKLAFCLCENAPGAVAGYLAFMNSGVVPLMLDADLPEERLDSFLQAYQPDWLWAPVRKEQEMRDRFGTGPVYADLSYALWKTGKDPSETRLHPLLTLLLATSGSTGSPKLVRLSRENLESNAASICEYLQISPKDRPITTLPMQYTYGLSIINSHLLAGATILMTKSSYVQNDFWTFLAEEKATTFGGVPYTYQILKKLRVFRKPIPSIAYLTQAGGKLPTELQEEIGIWAQKTGVKFYVMYGQTEATARMSYLPADKCLEKIGSMGVAIPGGRFSLIDEDGKEIEEPETAGELIYEGPNVSLGYAENREDLGRGDERHGRLQTGDIAKRDADGFYYIVGRKKRFIKMYGIRVNLDQCEKLLRAEYPAAEIVCCGTDDHIRVCVTDEQIAREAAAKLADLLKLNERGFSGLYVPEIPRNSSGKIQYDKLLHTEAP